MQPSIKIIQKNAKFRYFWMKYITWFDLNQHCARWLIGTYSKKLNYLYMDIDLDEADAEYYYICWVSLPFVHEKNFHLAFIYKEWTSIDIDENWVRCVIENAERITIEKKDIYFHRKWHIPAYNTCRNWQFAYQILEAKNEI